MASKKSPKTKGQPKNVKNAPAKNSPKSREPEDVREEARETCPEAPAVEVDTVPIGHLEEKALPEDKDFESPAMPAPQELEVKEELAQAMKESGETLVEKSQEERPQAAAGRSGPRLPGGIIPRPLYRGNAYLPHMATVVDVIRETANIRTLRLVLDDKEAMESFTFEPGQVGQISVFGAGEATFVINSPPSQKEYLQFSVMRTGELTDAIHGLSIDDKVGLRAPLGNFFPYNDWKGKNVFFIGGGIGMAPIRTIMYHVLEHKADYGKVSLLYGARSPVDMAYGYELDGWKNDPNLDCTLCIDNPYENWGHEVGLIPTVLEKINPSPENTVAVLCGPPIMIKFTLQTLKKLGFQPANIVTTLEKRMKCGIGICGRCNIGDRFVCVDGPVFTLEELDELPPDL